MTREINLIKQYVAEDDTVNVNDHIIRLKELFERFMSAHNMYYETLTEDKDIDESDVYFYDKQSSYISVLDSVKNYNKHAEIKVEIPPISDTSEELSRNELLRLLNLPKVELDVFSGDQLHFHQFIRACLVLLGQRR